MEITALLQKCQEVPGTTLTPCPQGAELTLHQADGEGRMRFFAVLPGVTLAYISVHAPTWPAPELEPNGIDSKGPLLINYCVTGRCEMILNSTNYVYLSDRQLSLTERFARNHYIYPRSVYEGLEFFIDLDAATAPGSCLLQDFALDLRSLPQRYCPDGSTYISADTTNIQAALQALWALGTRADAHSHFRRRVETLSLLGQLCYQPDVPVPQVCTFYTESQVAIAKAVEARISADLSRHLPARELAKQFSVSETSMKNYFRGVYGQNLSAYLRDLRMKKAAELLAQSKVSVAEIAAQVGYTNQSKFAGVFKQQYGVTPLEYRRAKHLEQDS